ncbi:hypothetical protein PHYBOEH_011179 [Phytophthora boehmeriae]|uniref:Uncharacterized protein n=1 Tax=Phytophthora boehmeriae TaxID=109152 RepID=A0A8T1X1L9_9STRA|nr:hypothetical protein PHYBOEH_011179 [Phytophthora boehmeriae]
MIKGFKFVFALVGSAGVAAFVNAELEDVPSFTVPAFDYGSLRNGDSPARMLNALERGGIIALKNIPNYANVRERFLASAVQCAVASEKEDESVRFLSTKEFHDGTRRLTLRAAAGRELMDLDGDAMNAISVNCPGHRELHVEFSSMVERAVDTFASALDDTDFTMGDGETHISARKLVGDAKRLDHFHAYEAATPPPSSARRSLSAEEVERDLSLAMHEDHGLFIAMAAPKFFSVAAEDGSVRERRLKSDASGLVIGASELDEIVRPDLKADELVIMIGSGASRWLETSHHLPAVMHGMRMPEEMIWDDEATPGQRNLRAWFGKMTLLPAYQRLLESRMYFDDFTNRTTRHLLSAGSSDDDLKTIGCTGGRHLVESEGSCTFKICTLKEGVERPPTVGCKQACNYNTEFFDAKCEKKCDCASTTTQADVCWMLCVARLPVSECALEDQECSGLKMICTANTTTAPPAMTTEAPIATGTPLPMTQTPTEAPLSTQPVEPSATTPAPIAAVTPLPTASPEPTVVPLPTSPEHPTSTPIATADPVPITTSPQSEVPAATETPLSTSAAPSSPTQAPISTPTTPPTSTAPSATPMASTVTPSSTSDASEAVETSTEEPEIPGGHC